MSRTQASTLMVALLLNGCAGFDPSTAFRDERLEKCLAYEDGKHLFAAFELGRLGDLWGRVPQLGQAPGLDGSLERPAFVALFDGPFVGPATTGLRQAELRNVLCLIVHNADGSYSKAEGAILYSDVDFSDVQIES